MSVGKRIKQAREKLGLTQAELARQVGVSRTAVGMWENGAAFPQHKNVPRLSEILGLHPASFDPYSGSTVTPVLTSSYTNQIPVLDWTELQAWSGGEINMGATASREFLQVDSSIGKRTIALRIKDESMCPDFRINDEILIDPDLEPEEDDCVLVRITKTGQEVFRHYVPRRGGAYDLLAENPEWPTVTINATNPAEMLGVLIEHRRKRRR